MGILIDDLGDAHQTLRSSHLNAQQAASKGGWCCGRLSYRLLSVRAHAKRTTGGKTGRGEPGSTVQPAQRVGDEGTEGPCCAGTLAGEGECVLHPLWDALHY